MSSNPTSLDFVIRGEMKSVPIEKLPYILFDEPLGPELAPSSGRLIFPHASESVAINEIEVKRCTHYFYFNITKATAVPASVNAVEFLLAYAHDQNKLHGRLKAKQCPFCLNATENIFKSHYSKAKSYGTCNACLAIGAANKRQPERIQTIMLRGKKEGYAIYPDETKKHCYVCQICDRTVDAKAMGYKTEEPYHNSLRGKGVCNACKKLHTFRECAGCKGWTIKQAENKIKKSYFCDSCLSDMREWQAKEELSLTPVRKPLPASAGTLRRRRTFGVEMEINNIEGMGDLADEISALRVEGLEFGVWEDGSVSDGFEVVSQPGEREIITKAMKELCAVVKGYPHSFSRCGLHVHIHDGQINKDRQVRGWLCAEAFMLSLVPEWRRNDTFCRPYSNDWGAGDTLAMDFERLKDYYSDDRYRTLNLCAVEKHGTLEVRLHQGTGNYRKIAHWITILDKLWSFSGKAKKEDFASLYNLCRKPIMHGKEICELLDLPKTTRRYVKETQAKYALTNAGQIHVETRDNAVVRLEERRQARERAEAQAMQRARAYGEGIGDRQAVQSFIRTYQWVNASYVEAPEDAMLTPVDAMETVIDASGTVRTSN